MKKVVTVLGARPQFIKASVVSHVIAQTPDLSEVLVHTGQHFDVNMSDVFFTELGMSRPDYFLDIHGGGHGAMTGRMLAEVERVLLQEKPDAVLVYGDTNSTLAGALAAVKLHIPVAHVEAGLRSFNMAMPEEVNRILTDRISTWLFSPTETARQNLLREGMDPGAITVTGDVMYDVALHHGSRADPTKLLARHDLKPGCYVLATIHRAENTDDLGRLSVILQGLSEVAQTLPVVWPIHPRTRASLKRYERLSRLAVGVKIIDPVGYLDMVRLEKAAAVIATDSGGVQKEAFFHGVPCVTMRDETEWIELVDAGWNRLAPPRDARFLAEQVLTAIGTRGQDVKPYGTGDAAQKIVTTLVSGLRG